MGVTYQPLYYSGLATYAVLQEVNFTEEENPMSYLLQLLEKVLLKAMISYPTKPHDLLKQFSFSTMYLIRLYQLKKKKANKKKDDPYLNDNHLVVKIF